MNIMTEPIHEITASQKSKAELLKLIYGKEQWQHFATEIPKEHWEKFHPPTHVMDTRSGEVINLVDEGIRRGLIFKTVKH